MTQDSVEQMRYLQSLGVFWTREPSLRLLDSIYTVHKVVGRHLPALNWEIGDVLRELGVAVQGINHGFYMRSNGMAGGTVINDESMIVVEGLPPIAWTLVRRLHGAVGPMPSTLDWAKFVRITHPMVVRQLTRYGPNRVELAWLEWTSKVLARGLPCTD